MFPSLILLSLGDSTQEHLLKDMYAPLLTTQISSRYPTVTLKSASETLQTIQSSIPPPTVLVIDGGITKPVFAKFHRRLAHFVKEEGGTVIFGLLFSSFVSPPHLGAMFQAFGFDWGFGDYTRNDLALARYSDGQAMLGGHASGLAPSCSWKAVHLKNLPQQARLYVPTEDSDDQSPAVLARCGRGRIGYVGDVNNEETSQRLILRMLGECSYI